MMKNRLRKREMTVEERKMIEETLEKWWREFEKKIIAHIPENEKYKYVSSKSCFELNSNEVLVDENGAVYFTYEEIGEESTYEGRIYNGKVEQGVPY